MKRKIAYVTQSKFKIEENRVFSDSFKLSNGMLVGEQFEFQIEQIKIKEILEVSLEAMVTDEVTKAYSKLRIPCIVEHAGLIFTSCGDLYPGGLTKPMWKILGDRFVEETGSADRPAIARAVVAYCDGMEIKTFTGETKGTIAPMPRGTHDFYWDTIFQPEGQNLTYAEIVDDPSQGMAAKIQISQSSKAMALFLEDLISSPAPLLWKGI